MQIAIIDGYIDEPACLGVPPYISPYVRYLVGAIEDSGSDHVYITIDEVRQGSKKLKILDRCKILIIVAGAVVPGKYLGGNPISFREALKLADEFRGISIIGGPAGEFGFFDTLTGGVKNPDHGKFLHRCKGDIDACMYDFIAFGDFSDRRRSIPEQNKWSIQGASVVGEHRLPTDQLIAEVDSYRGCSRYFTGGCSFCIEPGYGKPKFREQEDIIAEVKKLKQSGINHFRMGGQSCIYSYKAEGIGSMASPRPRPEELEKLFSGLRGVIGRGILHVDNANPAVISDHPIQARLITKTLVKYGTSGNVLAFGMESADPEVYKANNLNATADQVMTAIELVNDYGRDRGPTGLPDLLPGLNFITGLPGESKDTFKLNLEFLQDVRSRGLLLRRINIRQVAGTRIHYKAGKYKKEFRRFKESVRKEIDFSMLRQVVPEGTLLRDVITEVHDGNITFGRQLGTYPILVGIPYKLELRKKMDVYIFDHGYRSVTGFEYPFPLNKAPLSHIKTLPGLGAKRAARLVRGRPFDRPDDVYRVLDDPKTAENLLKMVTLKKSL